MLHMSTKYIAMYIVDMNIYSPVHCPHLFWPRLGRGGGLMEATRYCDQLYGHPKKSHTAAGDLDSLLVPPLCMDASIDRSMRKLVGCK
jgi:hypothetical protein